MMDVLEATRNVTEPVIQYWYVKLSLVQRGGLPPHLLAPRSARAGAQDLGHRARADGDRARRHAGGNERGASGRGERDRAHS